MVKDDRNFTTRRWLSCYCIDDSRDRNLEDVLFLYELAQSVGQNLDAQNGPQLFVSTLPARRNFSTAWSG